jgi:hypothetical protein
MSSDSFVIQIAGRDYRIPQDLDLNEQIEMEAAADALEDKPPTMFARQIVWMIMRRDNPDVTLEQAGASMTMGALLEAESAEEEPPPIPLSEPAPPSGLSSVPGNGNGSTATSVKVETREATGRL